MNTIKNVSETIHIGSDFLTGKLLATAECHIREDTIIVTIIGEDTLKISDSIKKGQYDVFIVGKDYSYKLVMGDIEFIHDISLH